MIKYVHWIQRTEIVDNDNIEDLEKVNEVNDLEENSKKEILNNLEKLHDMVEDNDPNDQDQAVSEVRNIWILSPLVLSKRKKNVLVLLI